MSKSFALVARCTALRATLKKTAEQLNDDEREQIWVFLNIAADKNHQLPQAYLHVLGRYVMFHAHCNPLAEKTTNNIQKIHEALGNFTEGIDLPANLVPQIDLYLQAWLALARAYEQIVEKVAEHHKALES